MGTEQSAAEGVDVSSWKLLGIVKDPPGDIADGKKSVVWASVKLDGDEGGDVLEVPIRLTSVDGLLYPRQVDLRFTDSVNTKSRKVLVRSANDV